MKEANYNAILLVDASAKDVFSSINNVVQWWTYDLEGSSQKVDDVFTVTFGDIHVSTQKVVEMIPNKKIVWLVTDSNLSFIKQKDEWTNTTIVFDLSEEDNKTQINFTHFGLLPAIECFANCSKGWDYFIKGSLYKLVTEGKGTPGLI